MAFPRAAASISEAAVQYAKNLSCWFRDYITAIKHGRLHPFTPLERKVREATRNEPWWAHLRGIEASGMHLGVQLDVNSMNLQRHHLIQTTALSSMYYTTKHVLVVRCVSGCACISHGVSSRQVEECLQSESGLGNLSEGVTVGIASAGVHIEAWRGRLCF